MKKIITSLLVVGFVGISSLFACEHTWDGSDCARCGGGADPIAVLSKTASDAGDAVSNYAACVAENAVAGAVAGSVLPGVGTGIGAVIGGITGVVTCTGSSDDE